MTRRERTLIGLLVAVVLIAILALIRSQPWGRLDIRLFKPNTKDWIACIRLNQEGKATSS
jgi:Tfp pilus assembly protein PilE